MNIKDIYVGMPVKVPVKKSIGDYTIEEAIDSWKKDCLNVNLHVTQIAEKIVEISNGKRAYTFHPSDIEPLHPIAPRYPSDVKVWVKHSEGIIEERIYLHPGEKNGSIICVTRNEDHWYKEGNIYGTHFWPAGQWSFNKSDLMPKIQLTYDEAIALAAKQLGKEVDELEVVEKIK